MGMTKQQALISSRNLPRMFGVSTTDLGFLTGSRSLA